MKNKQWYYRGCLRGCNYACSYCPFSKRKDTKQQLQQDREQLFSFIRWMQQNAGKRVPEGAVQIVPYGEAMQHTYYWEGLAKLSQNPALSAVGIQSNFSFPVEKMLSVYDAFGGQREKLRLWGTFHPEMTTVDSFVRQCRLILDAGIKYCVGAVAVPKWLETFKILREQLPKEVYFWLNRMDERRIPGRPGGSAREGKCSYTSAEQEAFDEMDPWFFMERQHYPAQVFRCRDSVFVQGDGTVYGCNLCRQPMGNLYQNPQCIREKRCSRRECSCYLSYCNRKETQLLFFEPYPAFRIPHYPKAVFFDIDGTLVPYGQRQISEENRRRLCQLAEHCQLYLATTLPMSHAWKKLPQMAELFSGGVFAGGSHLVIKERHWEKVDALPSRTYAIMENVQRKWGGRLRGYQKNGRVYKIALAFPQRQQKEETFWQQIEQEVKRNLEFSDTCRYVVEDSVFQILPKESGKAEGVMRICQEMEYRKEEIVVVGNSPQDDSMLLTFPQAVCVENGNPVSFTNKKIILNQE